VKESGQSNNRVKNYYNEVADEYNDVFYIKENEYPPLKYRHKYILEMINEEKLPADSKILDIGCGPGELVLDLARSFNNIYGIDISEEMIRIARDKMDNHNLSGKSIIFGVGDIEKLGLKDNYFDVVVCSGIVEYLRNDDLWVDEIKRVMKTDGILIVNVTNKCAIRRLTMPLLNLIKSVPGFYSCMNFIKTKILGKEKLNMFPFKPRVHKPKDFDDFLETNGLSKISHNYFDFSIFPYPVDTVLDFMLLKARKRMEKRSSSNAWITGNGYIVKCRKV